MPLAPLPVIYNNTLNKHPPTEVGMRLSDCIQLKRLGIFRDYQINKLSCVESYAYKMNEQRAVGFVVVSVVGVVIVGIICAFCVGLVGVSSWMKTSRIKAARRKKRKIKEVLVFSFVDCYFLVLNR